MYTVTTTLFRNGKTETRTVDRIKSFERAADKFVQTTETLLDYTPAPFDDSVHLMYVRAGIMAVTLKKR